MKLKDSLTNLNTIVDFSITISITVLVLHLQYYYYTVLVNLTNIK